MIRYYSWREIEGPVSPINIIVIGKKIKSFLSYLILWERENKGLVSHIKIVFHHREKEIIKALCSLI